MAVALVNSSSLLFVQQQQHHHQQRHFGSKRDWWERNKSGVIYSRDDYDDKSDDYDSDIDSDHDDDGDDKTRSQKRRQSQPQQPHHGLEPETQHIGIVRKITPFGAFVQIEGCPVQGLVHISEMADFYVGNINDFLTVGEQVTVVVLENYDNGDDSHRLRLSMRSDAPVKPVLPDDFNPVTVIAYNIPSDVYEDTIQNVFGRYGQVLKIDQLPMVNEEMKRHITKITFMDREEADACLKEKLIHIPYDIGATTYHAKVPVRLCRYQKFKQELLENMKAKYEQQKYQRDQRRFVDPRVQRSVDRALREIIPYYDDWKRTQPW